MEVRAPLFPKEPPTPVPSVAGPSYRGFGVRASVSTIQYACWDESGHRLGWGKGPGEGLGVTLMVEGLGFWHPSWGLGKRAGFWEMSGTGDPGPRRESRGPDLGPAVAWVPS